MGSSSDSAMFHILSIKTPNSILPISGDRTNIVLVVLVVVVPAIGVEVPSVVAIVLRTTPIVARLMPPLLYLLAPAASGIGREPVNTYGASGRPL